MIAALTALVTTPWITHPASADAFDTSVPPDFVLIDSAPGVDLYRKDYAGGTPDYVLVIDLAKKASLRLLTGTSDGSEGNPAFSTRPLQAYWEDFSSSNPDAVCVVNGSFFDLATDPAQLALPLKIDGEVLGQGYWQAEFNDQKRMLEIWEDHAKVSNLTPESLTASGAPDILSGLSEEADQDSNSLIGRTFAGIDDSDGDGIFESVLFLSSKTTRAADAAGVLRSFGADAVMMLDGGDSAQMLCKGEPQVYSDRPIPQVIGITAGEQAAYDVRVKNQTDWAVVVEGESLNIELVLTNTGSESWRVGEVTLVNQRNDWGAGQTLSMPNDVPPDGSVSFNWTTPIFEKTGVVVSQWNVLRGEKQFNDKPITISVIVIPPELADRKAELEAKIREWARQQVDDLEQLIMEWIQAQVRQGLEKICPFGAALPGVVVAGEIWKFRQRRRK